MKRLLLALFLAAGLAAAWHMLSSDGEDGPSYRTEIISRGDIKAQVTATGTLNPAQLVTVGAQVSGKISRLHVKVNDRVQKGQLLAEIDPSLLLAQLKQDSSALENSRLSFEQAERDLHRARTLLARDFIAKIDLERAQQTYLQAKNSYNSAKTTIERDELNLSYAKITSPIDGIIISQEVTEAQTLQSNFQAPSLFKIAGDLSAMKIDVNFSESDIHKISPGMPVSFTVNAFPERMFAGVVKTVNLNPSGTSSAATSSSGGVTYSVGVEVKNEDGALLPGMTASVSVILSEQKDVLRLPLAALRFNPPQERVSGLRKLFGVRPASPPAPARTAYDEDSATRIIYLLRNNKPAPVTVTTGATDEVFIEISGDGAQEGELVITGIQRVRKQ